jgi:hypothetical protein
MARSPERAMPALTSHPVSEPFVPDDFDVPPGPDGPGFRLEPLGPAHNQRDYEAWISSIDHIRSTPGWEDSRWPSPMTLEENLRDLEAHARDFAGREGFTYSILDGEEVVGCLYIYPDKTGTADAAVRSWTRESRADLEVPVWRAVSRWLEEAWPFSSVVYADRSEPLDAM